MSRKFELNARSRVLLWCSTDNPVDTQCLDLNGPGNMLFDAISELVNTKALYDAALKACDDPHEFTNILPSKSACEFFREVLLGERIAKEVPPIPDTVCGSPLSYDHESRLINHGGTVWTFDQFKSIIAKLPHNFDGVGELCNWFNVMSDFYDDDCDDWGDFDA